MKTVTFYHSVICPRCQMAGVFLSQLRDEFPDIEIDKVEYLTNLGRSRDAGVSRIPALVYGSETLSGFLLTKNRLREFLGSL